MTNTGNVPLSNVTITDPKLGMSGKWPVSATLAVGATATCPTKTYVVTAADVAHGSVDNVATATGTPPSGPDVSDDDHANIPTRGGRQPGDQPEKTVVDSDDADQPGRSARPSPTRSRDEHGQRAAHATSPSTT